MYSDCVFCERPFPTNAVIGTLSTGRRIAFDGAKGRLWVVCRRCERWNLVPLESRWEAIEEAERLFQNTRVRVSTEHIALARLQEGTELVRIGKPLRPEFAAWRYGDQFGRRRRKLILLGTGAAAVAGSIVTAGLLTGIISLSVLAQSGNLAGFVARRRTRVRIQTNEGQLLKLTSEQLNTACVGRYYDGSWFVKVDHAKSKTTSQFVDREAERVAALLLPRLNASGASRQQVVAAVSEIERHGGSETFVQQLIERPPLPSWRRKSYAPEHGIALAALPRTHRLALEMALHEERERQVLTGELKGLEAAWRSAEEIAAIADDLLIPAAVRARLNESAPHA